MDSMKSHDFCCLTRILFLALLSYSSHKTLKDNRCPVTCFWHRHMFISCSNSAQNTKQLSVLLITIASYFCWQSHEYLPIWLLFQENLLKCKRITLGNYSHSFGSEWLPHAKQHKNMPEKHAWSFIRKSQLRTIFEGWNQILKRWGFFFQRNLD